MAVATVPEKQNNTFESIIKTNEGGSVPPDGDISSMAEVTSVKKHNTRSDKDEASAPMGIATMAAATSLKSIIVELNHQ